MQLGRALVGPGVIDLAPDGESESTLRILFCMSCMELSSGSPGRFQVRPSVVLLRTL